MTSNDPQPQSQDTGMATCPFCLSEIPAAARKCRHCGEWQNGGKEAEPVPETVDVKLNANKPNDTSAFDIPEGFPKFSAYWGYIGAIINFIYAIIVITTAPEQDRWIVFLASFAPSIILAYFLITAPAKKRSGPYVFMSAIGFIFSLVVTIAAFSRSHLEMDVALFIIGAWIGFLLSAYAYQLASVFVKSEFEKNELRKKYFCEFRKSQKMYPFCSKYNKYLASLCGECKDVKRCFADKGEGCV